MSFALFPIGDGVVDAYDTTRVQESCSFDGVAEKLERVPVELGASKRVFTSSAWILLLEAHAGVYNATLPGNANINSSNLMAVAVNNGQIICHHFVGATDFHLRTTSIIRGTGWLHLHIIVDVDNAVLGDRVQIWVNNQRVSTFTVETYPAVPADMLYIHNAAASQKMGQAVSTAFARHGLAQAAYVDGSVLMPDSFGETVNGQWVPKSDADVIAAVEAAGGVNSYALTNLIGDGIDATTNLNHFTPTGMSHAVNGSKNTPSNRHPVFNDLHPDALGTLDDGNLSVSGTVHQVTDIALFSGRWSWRVTDAGAGGAYGIETADGTETTYTAAGSDALEFEFDMAAGTLEVRVNGAAPVSVAAGLSGVFLPLVKAPSTIDFETAPTDPSFKTINSGNMPPPSLVDPQVGVFLNGNADANGPFVPLGMPPDQAGVSTINGNAVVWGTHAIALPDGFKIITADTLYNAIGSNTYSIAVTQGGGGVLPPVPGQLS